MALERMRCGLEIKLAPSETDAKTGMFSGYGSVFGNVDGTGDVIERGAFKETLAEWNAKGKFPPMLLQHGGFFGSVDDLLPIGKWTSMEENSKGLKVEGQLYALGTERGQYIYEGMKAGTLDGMSIGYVPKQVKIGTKPDEPRRTLLAVDLIELSIVTFPANDRARISTVKSISDLTTISEDEAYLRDVCGLSKAHAKALISQIKSHARRDAEGSDDVGDVNQLGRLLLSSITSR